MRKRTSPVVWRAVVTLLALGAALPLVAIAWRVNAQRSPLRIGDEFVKVKVATVLDLNDLGVADINSDGWLDIFTLNHGSAELMLLNNAGAGFSNELYDLGLSQSGLNGWEPTVMKSAPAGPRGLWIYWAEHVLTVENHTSEFFGGFIEFLEDTRPEDVRVVRLDNFEINVTAFQLPSTENRVRVSYRSYGKGTLKLARPNAVSITLSFDMQTPLSRVYLGNQAVNPTEREMVLRLRDRHAGAWSDVDCDGNTDVFFARGGVRQNGGSLSGSVL